LKLIELEKILSSKLKTKNLREVVFLKFKEDKIVDKIDKSSSLLLEFLILFESETTLCCSRNIIAKFRLTLIEFRNLLITLIMFDCLKKNKD